LVVAALAAIDGGRRFEGGGEDALREGRCEEEAVICKPRRSRVREVEVEAERRRPEDEWCDEWVERDEAEVLRTGSAPRMGLKWCDCWEWCEVRSVDDPPREYDEVEAAELGE
jgi:hypothetical protein